MPYFGGTAGVIISKARARSVRKYCTVLRWPCHTGLPLHVERGGGGGGGDNGGVLPYNPSGSLGAVT